MDIVQKSVEVSPKIGTIQEFCEVSEGIHKILQCNAVACDIENYLFC